jgi:hypothetical protein
MKQLKSKLGLGILTAIVVVTTANAIPSNRWRLQFSGASHSSGTIVLRFTPVGGDAFDVQIGVPDGTEENAVAGLVVSALKETLRPDLYQVERDDGEDVLVRKQDGTADFALQVISSTVGDVRINPDRE